MDKKIDKSQRRKEKRRTIFIWSSIGMVLAGVIIFLILIAEPSVDTRDFSIAKVERGAMTTSVPATGRVVPAFEQIINSPVQSSLLKVYVHPGDTVKEGTPLLELDLREAETQFSKLMGERDIQTHELRQLELNNATAISELEMQIQVKEMQVEHLESDYRNEKRLDSIGSGTGERIRQAEIAHRTGQLELRQLRERLANERLRARAAEQVKSLGGSNSDKDIALTRHILEQGRVAAPRAGVVTYLLTEIGRTVGAGDKLAVVSDLSNFRVEGEVAEGNSNRVNVGSQAEVRIGSRRLPGHITNINPRSNNGMVPVSIALDNPSDPRIRAGLSADISIDYGYKEDVILLPNGSFFHGPGDYSIFVRDGNHLKRVKVKLGESNAKYIEVLSGLRPGDMAVISDMDNYKSKKSLKIK